MSLTPCPAYTPVAAGELPLTLMTLNDWALTCVTGADAEKYLQGQVTADVALLAESQQVLCAHCDAKGKMWSNLRLFHRNPGFAFILRRSVRDTQLTELKKYSVFSKVTIVPDDESVLLGVAGQQARESLAPFFEQLPDEQTPVVQSGTTSVLWLNSPAERFLLVMAPTDAKALTEELTEKAQFRDSQQWLALDIEAGLPVIDSVNSDQFLPQATNIQALNGISFKKGCYTGQEMVARAKFRGANKRALWTLAGQAGRVPTAGEDLELQLGENWRRTGTILAAIQRDDGQVWVQAVMNNDLAEDAVLRVRDDTTGTLAIIPLPYSLTEA
ncbi:tRNA-modifying protein YgfZ [Citrobacter sp. JGM124]|uniref:tRNA-modifying protein YgfZ n=1 Tax=Citrobacter sp. JGM124 TaxID=2799789 RepID=UPI001BA7533D|nr:tRNA-modifying protein YgfZ [Citrobacter sp. JGM124]MBS0849361.1 tRNA-modifying protein YgfZ [Citrobacter sp. JGM124]